MIIIRTGKNVYNKHTIVTKKIDCAQITSVRKEGFTVIWELVPRVTEKWPLSVLTGVRFVLSGLILEKIHESFVEKNGTVRFIRVSEERGSNVCLWSRLDTTTLTKALSGINHPTYHCRYAYMYLHVRVFEVH